MLVSAQLTKTPTVDRLIKIWTQRYVPDLAALTRNGDLSAFKICKQIASSEGRAETLDKLDDRALNISCQFASVRSRGLYELDPSIVDFSEAKQLSQYAVGIYAQLLEIYQNAAEPEGDLNSGRSPQVNWMPNMIPDVTSLATLLEPTLMLFQSQYVIAKDWRAIGGITTQLYFTNDLILRKLSPAERVIAAPYFKFVEEQIALPWERMCAAAARHDLCSPSFILVEQVLPMAQEIAEISFKRLAEMFPNHWSRRGKLTNADITHSCLRDLNMFQAYLWLCVLQEDYTPIEKELVDLCVMVLPRVEVKWELIEQWNLVLTEEMLKRMNSAQKDLFQPYAQSLINAFQANRHHLGANPDSRDPFASKSFSEPSYLDNLLPTAIKRGIA
ncbi:MAG TPA: hypothetical protein V6C84_10685 [Coleofasciculaceae cyanobacterium]|jgi:hypothetical protein